MVKLPIEFDLDRTPPLTCSVGEDGGFTLVRTNGDVEAVGAIGVVAGRYRVTDVAIGVDDPLIFQIESILNGAARNP